MQSLIGHTILVGLTYLDHQDKLIGQVQLFGAIKSASAEHGITIDTGNGEIFSMPFDIKAVLEAPRGEYKCSTGDKKIVNPDFLTSWRVRHVPPPDVPPSDIPREWAPNYAPSFMSDFWHVPREWTFTYIPDLEHNRRVIEANGKEYVGKHVLIGLTIYEHREEKKEFLKQEQLHGDIVRVNYREGIVIRLSSGGEYKLPPDLSFLQPAPPGKYTLRSTGETVNDPDFVSTFVYTGPKSISETLLSRFLRFLRRRFASVWQWRKPKV